jgi:hypothetical protein
MRRKKPKTVTDPVLPFKYSPKVTLHPGDVFRCTGGPYYITKGGDKIAMGERGLFRYVNMAKGGIMAVPHNPKDALPKGTVFIYMGEEAISEVTGTHFQPHKIRKSRKKK